MDVLGSNYCHTITTSSHKAAQQRSLCPVQVECSDRDLHSGVYGGSVHEAMTDLITLMGKPVSASTWDWEEGVGISQLSPVSGAFQHSV